MLKIHLPGVDSKMKYGSIDPGKSDRPMYQSFRNKNQAAFGDNMSFAIQKEFYFSA